MYKNGKAVVGAVLTGQHVGVGTIRNGENVGWDFITPSALVDLDDTVGVDGVTLVGIDGNAEQAGVGLFCGSIYTHISKVPIRVLYGVNQGFIIIVEES